MPTIQHQDYQGYAIVAMATPAGSGKYHSIFSVNPAGQSDAASPAPASAPALHQEKITDNPTFATEAEAIDAARARAQTWIDSHK